ncbi:isopentenyl-diphosphate Delta-isomerase [Pedobacter frigoris]|uniref:isopentenyl-diphosphate Delta-isomerase n=1 Tax=Pedobacter frigoris TaxID=2571272 RepID=UPI00292F1C28|nr:isopentenyl-diphosphate Delta-isomerase [Pedobacter frigoris]
MTENVILVDLNDNEIGIMPKMEAHLEGKLHRAFSIFIFNANGELLLQQRAFDKYHSGGKWTNTCCSHPRQGEETIDAAHRRLMEEMGMNAELRHVFSFTYRADLMDGISEYEFDHVFFGVSDELPVVNTNEVASYQYIGMETLLEELNTYPEKYTAWLKICFSRVMNNYNQIF